MSCGATGTRVIKVLCQDMTVDQLVRLVCSDPPHDDDVHYDETFSLEFGDWKGRADESN